MKQISPLNFSRHFIVGLGERNKQSNESKVSCCLARQIDAIESIWKAIRDEEEWGDDDDQDDVDSKVIDVNGDRYFISKEGKPCVQAQPWNNHVFRLDPRVNNFDHYPPNYLY